MKILLRFVLLFIILSVHFSAFSYSKKTAADVFFNFVVIEVGADHLEDVMGSEWLESIINRTELWTVSDAENFLNSLKSSRISKNDILQIIRDTSYLQYLKKRQVSFEFFREQDENVGTGTSVFIEFAEANYQYLGESFEEAMGHNWRPRIAESTQSWTYQDAKNFLLILETRIGVRITIQRIRSLPYFLDVSYPQFVNRLHLFQREEYLGVDGVTHQLQKALSGFVSGTNSLDGIISIINFLKARGFNNFEGLCCIKI